MIVKITQTASNVKQEYNIESESFYYQGKAGSLSPLQSVIMTNKDACIKGTYKISKLFNYIPLRYLFGKINLTRCFHLYKNNSKYGSFAFLRQGISKCHYVITLDSGEIFNLYSLSRGDFNYISIYLGDTQIALIETALSVDSFKYIHNLYILDDYNHLADTFSLFTIYYASYNFARRFHMSVGYTVAKSWTVSEYSDKYNPEWKEKCFSIKNS